MTKRITRMGMASVCLAVLVSGVACGGSDEVEPGAVVQGVGEVSTGDVTEIATPSGILEFRGRLLDKTPPEIVGSIPDGSRVLAISWQLRGYEPGVAKEMTPESPEVDISVTGGGDWVSIAHGSDPSSTLTSNGHSFYAVLGESSKMPSVRVVYDGAEQVTEIGKSPTPENSAKMLYRDLRVLEGECLIQEFRPAAEETGFTCSYSAYRLPYVAGVGWSKPGQEWLVVGIGVDTPLRFSAGGGERLAPEKAEVAVLRSDTAEPVEASSEHVSGYDAYSRAVVPLAAGKPGEVEGSLRVRATTESSDPQGRTVRDFRGAVRVSIPGPSS